ncbi:hypothetical protein D3C87_76440 [compost metagenome]
MEFDYDFSKCPICGSKMVDQEKHVTICKNGCCEYDFDTDSEKTLVYIVMFSEENYLINRYKSNSQDNLNSATVTIDTRSFLRQIDYWRENNRYLMKIMGRYDSEI